LHALLEIGAKKERILEKDSLLWRVGDERSSFEILERRKKA